jgi:hypothetical protein
MRKRFALLIVPLLAAAAALLPAAAASAQSADEVHPSIRYALAAEPGGVVVDDSTAYWPAIGMTLTVPREAARSVGPCATGRICAFQSSNLGGAYLSWASCGTYSTAALPSVGSIANARSSGTLQARNGTTVVASAGANSWTNVFSTVTNVRC